MKPRETRVWSEGATRKFRLPETVARESGHNPIELQTESGVRRLNSRSEPFLSVLRKRASELWRETDKLGLVHSDWLRFELGMPLRGPEKPL